MPEHDPEQSPDFGRGAERLDVDPAGTLDRLPHSFDRCGLGPGETGRREVAIADGDGGVELSRLASVCCHQLCAPRPASLSPRCYRKCSTSTLASWRM
jgi:hypothetical protein